MDNKMHSAAVIAAALLREHPAPTTDTIVELISQALDAIDIATGLENSRVAKRAAALRINTVTRR